MSSLRAYFLVGPTAVGKTAVAQWIAERRGWEILSADSMLVYAGMDVGTAKPGREERGRVRYHGVDVVTPDQIFSAGAFRILALRVLAENARLGRTTVVCGGTGLYVKSLTHGLDAAPGDPVARARWTAVWQDGGVAALQGALREKAPALYASLPDRDHCRRLIRCLERLEVAGRADSAGWRHARPTVPLVGLVRGAADLETRIESRVSALYDRGLVEEVRALAQRHGALSDTARHAIGYAEALDYLAGRCSLTDARSRTVTRTRQLAKRQRTWLRHQAEVEWVEVGHSEDVPTTAARVMERWERLGPTPVVCEESERWRTSDRST